MGKSCILRPDREFRVRSWHLSSKPLPSPLVNGESCWVGNGGKSKHAIVYCCGAQLPGCRDWVSRVPGSIVSRRRRDLFKLVATNPSVLDIGLVTV